MRTFDDRDRRIADELVALREPFPGRVDVRARVLREIAAEREASRALRPSRQAWIAAALAVVAIACVVVANGANVVGGGGPGLSAAPGLARAALVTANALGSALAAFVGGLWSVAQELAELGLVAAIEATPVVGPAIYGALLVALTTALGWALRDARRRARADEEAR